MSPTLPSTRRVAIREGGAGEDDPVIGPSSRSFSSSVAAGKRAGGAGGGRHEVVQFSIADRSISQEIAGLNSIRNQPSGGKL